jgi:hypothetical protein
LNALAYIPASAAFLDDQKLAESTASRPPMSLRGLLDGARFLWLQRIVFALVIMDFVIMSVGYYRPLLPVFAKDIFRVGPAGFGMLASAPAIGGTLGTVAVLVMGDVRRKGQLALWAFLDFQLMSRRVRRHAELLGRRRARRLPRPDESPCKR